ncbi:unnamed protein product [Ectocarpus sp. CCAP 1310/34]|nr:unnamed protein product [Ectocarpus sp. CCAP 1310/34]
MATANANAAPGATRPVDQHVEFVVKPAEDLILEGSERSVIRVRAGTPYSCLMLKNQRFSSLFRHYAKHHGLRKDDLAYYFTEELQNEDTPETVFLLVRDEIVVRRRKSKSDSVSDDEAEVDPDSLCPDDIFIEQMGSLLDDDEHCDVTFFVGPSRTEVKAHKTHLVARSVYFRSMFRKGAMRESETSEVTVMEHDEATFRQMLEYIYTNRVKDMPGLSADEVIKLLALANEFLLEELKVLCEHSARKIVSVANVAKMLLAAERYQAETLKSSCLAYVQKNMPEVCRYPAFEAEVSANPKLSMFILQGMADAREEASGGGVKKATAMPRAKRRRVGSSGGMGARGRDGAEVPSGRL